MAGTPFLRGIPAGSPDWKAGVSDSGRSSLVRNPCAPPGETISPGGQAAAPLGRSRSLRGKPAAPAGTTRPLLGKSSPQREIAIVSRGSPRPPAGKHKGRGGVPHHRSRPRHPPRSVAGKVFSTILRIPLHLSHTIGLNGAESIEDHAPIAIPDDDGFADLTLSI